MIKVEICIKTKFVVATRDGEIIYSGGITEGKTLEETMIWAISTFENCSEVCL